MTQPMMRRAASLGPWIAAIALVGLWAPGCSRRAARPVEGRGGDATGAAASAGGAVSPNLGARARAVSRKAWEAIRAGKRSTSLDEQTARALRRVRELDAQVEFDAKGALAGVDMTANRLAATDADIEAIASIAGLRKLKAAGGEITNRAADSLQAAKSLEELALIHARINDDGLARLCRMASLRSLDLRGCADITEHGLAQLTSLPNLESLKLGGARITDSSMAALKGLNRLKSLAIEDCGVTNDGLECIEGAPLEELDVFRCYRINDEGLAHCRRLASLERLSLRDLPVTGAGLRHLSGLPKLSDLRLNETAVRDDGLRNIQRLASLRRLELRRTLITDAGLQALSGLTGLAYLDLADNGLTDKAVASLEDLKSLEALYLEGNRGVTDQSIPALAKLGRLKTLDVAGTGITDAGAESLAESLPRCRIQR